MSAIFSDDAIAHYEVIGRGKPIVFLHSWIGSWRYWVPTMQACASCNRAYALDLWGFGDSGKYPQRYTLERQIALLDDFIYQMGLQGVTLVGHGLGAVVAVYYAADHPDIIHRLMAISFPMGRAMLAKKLAVTTVEDAVHRLFGRDASLEVFQQESLKTDGRAVKIALHQAGGVDWRQLVQRVSVSALWIYGLKDPACQPPEPAALRFLPKRSHQLIFHKSGHFPMLSEPSQFVRLISEFIAVEPGADPSHLRIKNEWKRRVR